MLGALGPLSTLLLGTFVLLSGNGLLWTLLGVRASAEGFSTIVVGLMTAAYFAGFLAGTVRMPSLVRSVGHIRVFAALASTASAVALMFALLVHPIAWVVLRALSGFCFAGLYLVIESWLHRQADNHNRGTLLAIYMVINHGALAMGQQLLNLSSPELNTLFILSSIMVSMALVPVALGRATGPTLPEASKIGMRELMESSPAGFIVATVSGVFGGAFYGLSPVFALAAGLNLAQTTALVSAGIVGGVLFQWPVGMMSDRADRRLIMVTILAILVCCSLSLGFLQVEPIVQVFLTFGFGGMAFCLYPLAVSHANDMMPEGDYVALAGSLNFQYALGAIFGPLLISGMMEFLGGGLLFISMGIIAAITCFFLLYRVQRRDTPDLAETTTYVPLTRTSTAIVQMVPVDEVSPTLAEDVEKDEEAGEKADNVENPERHSPNAPPGNNQA